LEKYFCSTCDQDIAELLYFVISTCDQRSSFHRLPYTPSPACEYQPFFIWLMLDCWSRPCESTNQQIQTQKFRSSRKNRSAIETNI